MADGQLGTVLRHIRQLAASHDAKDLTDRKLLDDFSLHRDQAAFAVLVNRHGSLVLSVCRHVLQHRHDAEDAFQATFLLLAQNAASIRKREALASWLYGVAYRVAMKAKRSAARRRVHERQGTTMPQPDASWHLVWRKVQAVLDEEIHRLPEKYRAPFVLCFLEGKSRAEAAHELDWKEGTLSSRLARARQQLQKRLARRGITLSAVLGAAAVSANTSTAAIPASLLDSAVQNALVSIAKKTAVAGAISAQVAALVQGASKTMLYSKLKIATIILLAVSAATTGLGMLGHHLLAANPHDTPQGDSSKPSDQEPRQPAIPVNGRALKSKITPANASKVEELAHLDKDVWKIEWRRDGTQVAFVFWEKPVEILDGKTLKLIRTLGEDKKVIHFAFSPEQDRMAFCENGSKAELLTSRSGQAIEINAENDQPQLDFSPDGKVLATGGYGNTARLWCGYCGQAIRSLDMGDKKGGLSVAFSPDSKIIAVANRNDTTRLFDVSTGELLHELDKTMCHDIRFHPDGKTLAVAYVDGNVGLWNVEDGKLLHMADTGAKEIYTLDWSPDGDILATAGLNGSLKLWNPKDMSVLKEIGVPEWIISIRFSPDGGRLLTAGGSEMPSSDRQVKVWGLPHD